jgi:predicted NBD/HSP70 family sugar kinase
MHPRPRESKLIAKKHRILNLIFREKHCSRFYLARKLNINASMIGNYVEEFLKKGLLLEDYAGPTRRGRSPVPVRLNPDYGSFLGLDFEALRIRTVLTDFAGEILAEKEIPLWPGIGRTDVLDAVLSAAKQTAQQAGTRRLWAVGIAAPGQVDCLQGLILRYELLPDFLEVPLRDHFQAHFDCPIFVEDNIRALTLAELLRGAGRGHRHFLCLVIRSGLGVGIVINGRIYAGANGMAGEVGYTVFPQNAQARTMTELVSAKGIVGQALRFLKTARKTALRQSLLEMADNLTLSDIVAAAESGDGRLRHLLEKVGQTLGLVTANLANLFAPEKIILMGEVPSCCAFVRHELEQGFRRHTLIQILKDMVLADGNLTGFAGAMGAAYLGFMKTFPEEENISGEPSTNVAAMTGGP